eukprot:11083.XXX_614690_615880_1 [CDS] Oithona nana genome sequencing.
MMTTVRTSKRIALGGLFAIAFLVLCLLALKDLNDKLNVMTASNAGYQTMTDVQGDKIKSLTSELEVLRVSKLEEVKAIKEESKLQEKKFMELRDKFNALNLENQRCAGQLNDIVERKSKLESERDELQRGSARQKSEADHLSIQFRDQIARLSLDRDACLRQYDALFKLHQAASDDVASLNQDKERLSLQLTDVTADSNSAQKSTTKVNKPQIQIPNNQRHQQKSSSIQPIGLIEQPHKSHKLSTSSRIVAPAAAVAAEPPHEVVPIHQLRKEDVMEAPKMKFENLDAQVDPHEQDHPGLQAPVYRDNQNVAAFEEDDIEDSADGQLPMDYMNNHRGNDQRYDHLNDIDYDFQADFHPRKRPRPVVVPHHPAVLEPRQQQRFLAHRQQQAVVNRGL